MDSLGARPIALKDAVSLAQQNALGAVQARGQVRSAESGVRAARSALFPSLNLTMGQVNQSGDRFDSQGRLWEQEFGNAIMDETNLIVKGGNYGWPKCEGTSGQCGTSGFLAPKATYPTAAGSCSGPSRPPPLTASLRGPVRT